MGLVATLLICAWFTGLGTGLFCRLAFGKS